MSLSIDGFNSVAEGSMQVAWHEERGAPGERIAGVLLLDETDYTTAMQTALGVLEEEARKLVLKRVDAMSRNEHMKERKLA